MPDASTAPAGRRLEQAATASAGLLVATSAGGALAPGVGGAVHAAASVAFFAVGTGLMAWAYAIALSRSRTEALNVPGVFFVAGGAAPAPTRRRLHAALAVEVVAVVSAASIRPFTQVAFGILAPMLGLGLMALWGARHGAFPVRGATAVSRPPHGDGGECSDG